MSANTASPWVRFVAENSLPRLSTVPAVDMARAILNDFRVLSQRGHPLSDDGTSVVKDDRR